MTTPPPAQFRNQAELVEYIGAMERRIAMIEQENQQQQLALDGLYQRGEASAPVKANLPETQLLSKNFLGRAFAVWGHYFVAQLIIAIGISAVYLVVVLLLIVVSRGGSG